MTSWSHFLHFTKNSCSIMVAKNHLCAIGNSPSRVTACAMPQRCRRPDFIYIDTRTRSQSLRFARVCKSELTARSALPLTRQPRGSGRCWAKWPRCWPGRSPKGDVCAPGLVGRFEHGHFLAQQLVHVNMTAPDKLWLGGLHCLPLWCVPGSTGWLLS